MKTKEHLYKIGTVLAYKGQLIKIDNSSETSYHCLVMAPGCKEVKGAWYLAETIDKFADLRPPEDWEKALHGQHVFRIGTILSYNGKVLKVQGWSPSEYHCLAIDPNEKNVKDVWYKTIDLNTRATQKQQTDWDNAKQCQEQMRAVICTYRKAIASISEITTTSKTKGL